VNRLVAAMTADELLERVHHADTRLAAAMTMQLLRSSLGRRITTCWECGERFENAVLTVAAGRRCPRCESRLVKVEGQS